MGYIVGLFIWRKVVSGRMVTFPSRVNLSEGCFVSMYMISQMTKSTSDLCWMKLLGV